MTIDESLRSAAGQELIGRVADAFAIDEQSARSAVYALGDELAARIQRTMLSRGGVADVVSLVTAPGASRALSDSDGLSSPEMIANGDQILDVLIGNKHVSRKIAARAASRSGIDAATAQKMLPVVATLLIGELQKQSGPAIAKVASLIPAFSGAGGSPLPMPGDTFPPARRDVNSTPDDQPPIGAPGRPADIPRGPIDAGNPLPIPGDNIPGVGRRNRYPGPASEPEDNPYSRLPDIVRRGGEQVPGPDGGSLENVIRSILGNLLGSNSGVVGTMIKLFLIRWIASIVRRVLSQVLVRR
ncbi:DUF937 domain-containing protein [Hyphomicrobium facile]|uniref:DUF937 domain-containing protein n=1 Tax=Hyphomicrobium facile TaxID=51670 RepID=A0A1I7NEL9_9HYPH|nr:DUF937 domain-containing protein [Hyphomicrobium facile]SFV32996.1 protein of unknown function [Hyphomicrobium facile]